MVQPSMKILVLSESISQHSAAFITMQLSLGVCSSQILLSNNTPGSSQALFILENDDRYNKAEDRSFDVVK